MKRFKPEHIYEHGPVQLLIQAVFLLKILPVGIEKDLLNDHSHFFIPHKYKHGLPHHDRNCLFEAV